MQIVVFGALYSKTYLSSLQRGNKALSIRPGSKDSKDVENEQLILPIKVGDTDATRDHVLVVKEVDVQAFHPS